MRKITIYIVLAMIMVNAAFAIGLSPAKKSFDLDYENGIAEGKIRVINNEGKELGVLIQATGHLSEYVHFSKTEFIIGAGQSEDYITYNVNISDIPLADMRSTKISIYVIEVPTSISLSGSGASATAAAIHKLALSFPFESPVRPEKKEEEAPADSQSGGIHSSESKETEYVPLEDLEEPVEESEVEEIEQKRSFNMFIYVVIALVGLNLLWILFLFRKKKK